MFYSWFLTEKKCCCKKKAFFIPRMTSLCNNRCFIHVLYKYYIFEPVASRDICKE